VIIAVMVARFIITLSRTPLLPFQLEDKSWLRDWLAFSVRLGAHACCEAATHVCMRRNALYKVCCPANPCRLPPPMTSS
jgi:hypothetical protein